MRVSPRGSPGVLPVGASVEVLPVLFSHLFFLNPIQMCVSQCLPRSEQISTAGNSAPGFPARQFRAGGSGGGRGMLLAKNKTREGRLARPFLPSIASLKGSTSHHPFPCRRRQRRDAAVPVRSPLPVPGAVPSPAIPLAFRWSPTSWRDSLPVWPVGFLGRMEPRDRTRGGVFCRAARCTAPRSGALK